MGIIEKWKVRREIKQILNSKDSEKVESVEDFHKDENLENIILSIQDRNKRAQALQKTIHKIYNKEVIEAILATLNDDNIIKMLDKTMSNLDDDDRYILLKSIDSNEKRLHSIKKAYNYLSDTELSNLLDTVKDKNLEKKTDKKAKKKQIDVECMRSDIEDTKIDIITNKIIINYINNGTLLHMRELLGCMQLDTSKVKVVENALEQENKLRDKIKKGELPSEYKKTDSEGRTYTIKNTIFDNEGKKLLIRKSFEYINGSKSVEKRKKAVIIKLYREGIYTYEEARNILKNSINNKQVEKEAKDNLLKIEGRRKFMQEMQEKDLIDTPITIEETGNIVEIPEDDEISDR